MPKDKRFRAFGNSIASVDVNRNLPDDVFVGAWAKFLFCESDRIFSSEFISVIKKLVDIERAEVACLLNISRSGGADFESSSVFFMDALVSESEYVEWLKGGVSGDGWIFSLDRYICTSDVGTWCVYCEKDNDVAVVGLRDGCDLDLKEMAFEGVLAMPIESVISGGANPMFPFDRLTASWRKALIENYGVRV